MTFFVILAWLTVAFIHFGDSSIAAIIAAIASVFNAYLVIHAHGVQHEIREDVRYTRKDTELRREQIDDLRSLSVERQRQINKLSRIADRLEALDLEDISTSVKRIEHHVANDDN